MMKSRGSHATAVAVAVAALLACTAALPQREQEVDRILSKMSGDHSTDSRYDSGGGQKVRNLDALGGGNLVRGVRQAHRPDYAIPYISGRPFEYMSPFAGKREIMMRPFQYRDLGSIYADVPKRNFDEIDRTGFDSFVKKRNFDEIDRTGFGTFVKRAPSDADIYPLPPYALRLYDREH